MFGESGHKSLLLNRSNTMFYFGWHVTSGMKSKPKVYVSGSLNCFSSLFREMGTKTK